MGIEVDEVTGLLGGRVNVEGRLDMRSMIARDRTIHEGIRVLMACVILICAVSCRSWYEQTYRPRAGIAGQLYVHEGGNLRMIEMESGLTRRIDLLGRVSVGGIAAISFVEEVRAFLVEARNSDVIDLVAPSGETIEEAPWGLDGTRMHGLSVSPSGSHIAYNTPQKTLVIRDLKSGVESDLGIEVWTAVRPIWVGERLLLFHRSEAKGIGATASAWLWDTADGRLVHFDDQIVTCVPYSPRSGSALCSSSRRYYSVLNGLDRSSVAENRPEMFSEGCWSPDGSWVAYSRIVDGALIEAPLGLYVFNPSTGVEVQVALMSVNSCFWL